MIWNKNFSDRLKNWAELRESVLSLPVDTALMQINQWWFSTPWTPYYLHWDDAKTWPDPWQLLSDNIYCDVARGLGIVYTIAMLERPDMSDAKLVETKNCNLVLVAEGKYILNYSAHDIVNTNLGTVNIKRCITQEQILQKLL